MLSSHSPLVVFEYMNRFHEAPPGGVAVAGFFDSIPPVGPADAVWADGPALARTVSDSSTWIPLFIADLVARPTREQRVQYQRMCRAPRLTTFRQCPYLP